MTGPFQTFHHMSSTSRKGTDRWLLALLVVAIIGGLRVLSSHGPASRTVELAALDAPQRERGQSVLETAPSPGRAGREVSSPLAGGSPLPLEAGTDAELQATWPVRMSVQSVEREPLEGVTISMEAQVPGQVPWEREVRSLEAGQIELDVPGGATRLKVSVEDPSWVALSSLDGSAVLLGAPAVLYVAPHRRLDLQLFDQSGRPWADGSVSFQHSDQARLLGGRPRRSRYLAAPDASGRCSFERIPDLPGQRLYFRSGTTSASLSLDDVRGSSYLWTVERAARQERGAVVGIVVDGSGQPVPDCNVHTPGASGRTDSLGRFELALPVGRMGSIQRVIAFKPGVGAGVATGEALLNLNSVEVELLETCEVKGVALDRKSEPLAGRVLVLSAPESSVDMGGYTSSIESLMNGPGSLVLDSEGRFEAQLVKGWRYAATAEDRRTLQQVQLESFDAIPRARDDRLVLTAQSMEVSRQVTVRMETEGGEAVEGASIMLRRQQPMTSGRARFMETDSEVTDAAGTCSFKNVDTRSAEIYVKLRQGRSFVHSIDPSAEVTQITIFPSRSIQFTVSDRAPVSARALGLELVDGKGVTLGTRWRMVDGWVDGDQFPWAGFAGSSRSVLAETDSRAVLWRVRGEGGEVLELGVVAFDETGHLAVQLGP